MVPLSELPQTLETDRLRLELITRDEASHMIAGRRQPHWHPDYPRRDDIDAATMAGDSWGPRHIVRKYDRVVFGSIGCYGAPVDQDGTPETEVGFGLVEEARGRGVMTEALRALCAAADGLGVRLRASAQPDNTASIKVLSKCGFTQLRGTTPDGELVMVRGLISR